MQLALADVPAATARPRKECDVPYTRDGIIDWGQLEDELPAPETDEEFEVEVANLDFSIPQPSNLHPYYHKSTDNDCIMVGHNCNCQQCREKEALPSLTRKRGRESAATACVIVEASPIPVSRPSPVALPATVKKDD